jgi:hypothetical protein
MVRSPRAYDFALGFQDAIEFATRSVAALSSGGEPYRRTVWCGMPLIPPRLLITTFYLYPTREDAEKGTKYGGTGFLLGVESKVDAGKFHVFGVTNWHVAIRDGCSVTRINRKDGGIEIFEFDPSEWIFRPHWHDIAIIPFEPDDAIFDVGIVTAGMLVTSKHVENQRIGPGDDIFMVGRFIDHDGGETNAPAVRFGHISMMPGVGIKQPTRAVLESVCVDMNSRTGFSGSPVFVYRTMGGEIENIGKMRFQENQFVSCLGIHWGQFPEEWEIKSTGKLRARSKRRSFIPGQYFRGLPIRLMQAALH